MPLELFEGRALFISFATAVDIINMLTANGQKDKFIQYCKDRNLTVRVPDNSSEALKRALRDNNVSSPISIEDLDKFIEMLISGGQANQLSADRQAIFEVPRDSANGLKQFLNENDFSDPLSVSIVGARQANCPDYRCPHSLVAP